MLRTSSPVLPISLAEFRQHARIDHDDEDAVLQTYLASAVEQAERAAGIGFSGSTWTWTGVFPSGDLDLGMSPLASVTLAYVDEDGEDATLTVGTDFTVEGSCLVAVDGWPTAEDGSEVTVTFVSGTGALPPPIRAAVLMTAMSAYENREEGGELTGAAQRLVGQYRRVWM